MRGNVWPAVRTRVAVGSRPTVQPARRVNRALDDGPVRKLEGGSPSSTDLEVLPGCGARDCGFEANREGRRAKSQSEAVLPGRLSSHLKS